MPFNPMSVHWCSHEMDGTAWVCLRRNGALVTIWTRRSRLHPANARRQVVR